VGREPGLRVLSKHGDELLLISEGEEVSKGDYVKVSDGRSGPSLLAQVYEIEYFDIPGIEEDLLRDLLLGGSTYSSSDPEYASITRRIKDVRLIRCKVRGTISESGLSPSVDWLPSRATGRVERMSGEELASLVSGEGPSIRIGRTLDGHPLELPLSALDGSLTLIVGKKGSGKSHLAKLLISGLVESGAYSLVFDINNEYVGITRDRSGEPSSIASRVYPLEPGGSLRFNLRYLGVNVMADVMRNVLNLPATSLREFLRIWSYLESTNRLSFAQLGEQIERWRANEMVRDALLSRYYSLASTRLFTEDRGIVFEDLIRDAESNGGGGAIVLMLAGASTLTRRVVVEAVLAKVAELLRSGAIPPVFILAEEAHMYVRDTYWEDLVTRMRHYGAFMIFVTNQPDALKDLVYRQADNLFLFNYANDRDIEFIARYSATDPETLSGILPTLRRGRSLMMGKATGWLPVVMDVDDADFQVLGQTRTFLEAARASRGPRLAPQRTAY
jgi:DNA helicase HerA-like ATPase